MQDIYDCTVQYIIENQNKFYRLAYSYVKEEQEEVRPIAVVRQAKNTMIARTSTP